MWNCYKICYVGLYGIELSKFVFDVFSKKYDGKLKI